VRDGTVCRSGDTVALLWTEIRYALRLMRRSPGFTLVVVVVLALSCGTNMAIFSIVDTVMLKNLPVRDPQQLVWLQWHSQAPLPADISGEPETKGEFFSFPTYLDLRAGTEREMTVFGFSDTSPGKKYTAVNLNGRGILARGVVVTGEYFSGLDVNLALGRPITPSDEAPNAIPVVVISDDFWAREFGRTSSAIGATLFIEGTPYVVVGITPPQFFGAEPEKRPDFWEPVGQWPGIRRSDANMFSDRTSRTFWWLSLMARLRPNAVRGRERTRLETLFQLSVTTGLNRQQAAGELLHLDLTPGRRGTSLLRDNFYHSLALWMAIAGVSLMVACGNVTVLILQRARTREAEMAVRRALGASRMGLSRQMFAETLLLSGGAGVLGAIFAFWGSQAVIGLMSGIIAPAGFEIHKSAPDLWVLCFCIVTVVLTGAICGFAPARVANRVDVASLLKESRGTGKGRRFLGVGNAIVSCQVAFSLLVTIGAGLFVRTIWNLEHAELGFNPDNLLVFDVDGAAHGYRHKALADLYERVLERVQALPGVVSASSSMTPLSSLWSESMDVVVDGRPESTNTRGLVSPNMVSINAVSANFFETAQIPLERGRDLLGTEADNTGKVAVVNEAFMHRYLRDRDPIGSTFYFGLTFLAKDVRTVVGIAKDVKYDGALGGAPLPMVYVSYSQNVEFLNMAADGMHFEVRTRGNPANLVGAVRSCVDSISPGLPLDGVQTQGQQIISSLAKQRLVAYLSGFFALLVLFLACISVYGAQAYAMTQRTHEIGVRLVLGASRANILWLALRESLLGAVAGVAVGLVGASLTTRLISSELYGVRPLDPAIVAAASVVLVAVVCFGGLIPAARASHIDPATALRQN
jgi:macrolide transport system ATP-binding/permease protein